MSQDNPTGGIDSETAEQTRENIRNLMESDGEMAENGNMREHYEVIERFDHGELPECPEMRNQQCPNCGAIESRERYVERRDFTVVECENCNLSLDIEDGGK